MLSKEVSSTIFWVFDMTRSVIESRFPEPLADILPTRSMGRYIYIYIFEETESLLIVAQNNAIRTNGIKAKLDNTQENSKCRLCRDSNEMSNHEISECSKLALPHKTGIDLVRKDDPLGIALEIKIWLHYVICTYKHPSSRMRQMNFFLILRQPNLNTKACVK